MTEITSIRDLVSLWPTRAELAMDIARQRPPRPVTVHQVQKWSEKGSIPAKYHLQVLRAANARGFPVTADLIIELHAAPSVATDGAAA